jgi:hypothetical protein
MAERIEVIVSAKDAVSGVIRSIGRQFGELGSVVEELTSKNIDWGRLATAAATMVILTVKESIRATIEYADDIRRLALVTGTTAEETSRLVQVTDDYGLSVQDLDASVRKLTQQGLSPTVETLADLSDQFLALNPGQERAAFLLENFGRTGQKFAELMSLGSDAILQMNDAVNENVILSQKQLDDARAYTIALDEWSDAVLGVKISIGSQLMPVMTDLMKHTSDLIEVDEILAQEKIPYGTKAWYERRDALLETMKAERQQKDALDATSEAMAGAGEAAKEAAVNHKALLDMTLKMVDATAMQINQMAYQDLYKQLADDADGLTESERAALNEIGIELGIFDQKAVSSSEKVRELNQAFIDGQVSIANYVGALKAIPAQVSTELVIAGGGQTEVLAGGYAEGTGGWKTVPPGYNNDTYMVGLTSGEKFNVVPQGEQTDMGSTNYFYGNTTFVVGEGMGTLMEQI